MLVSQACVGHFKLLLEGINIEVSSTLTLLRKLVQGTKGHLFLEFCIVKNKNRHEFMIGCRQKIQLNKN